MGLGALLRNITVTQENTVTGERRVDTIITGDALFPEWVQRGGYQGGMGLPGAWRASLLLSDLLGGLPWHAYVEGPDGLNVMRRPTPTLLERPAGRETRIRTFSSWALDLIWHGNAIALVTERDSLGEPATVLPISAREVWVKRIEERDGLRTIPVGAVGYNIGNVWYHPDDVIHIAGPHEPYAVRGWGVLENHLRTFEIAEDQDKQAGASTGAGIPTGVLNIESPDVEESEIVAAKTAWKAAQATRDIAALTPAIRFEPLAWNPTEAQLIEARRFTVAQLALIFGVPPRYLGAENSSRTYSNIEQEGLELIKFHLNGHLARFEQELARHLQPGTTVKANLDAVLRADTLTRYQAHAVAIQNRFLAPSEVRAYEDKAPLTPAQSAEFPAEPVPAPALPTAGAPE